MRQETALKIIIGIGIGGLLLHQLFMGYEWWFPTLKLTKTLTQGTFIFGLLTIVAFMALMSLGEMRSRSNVLITETERWSWNVKDRPYTAGEWLCVRLGGINAWGMSIEGQDGVLVVHKDAWKRMGGSVVALTNSKPAVLGELPQEAQDTIRRWGLKGPFHLGYAPSFVEARTRDYSKVARELSLKNREASANTRSAISTIKAMDLRNRQLVQAIEDDGKPKAVTWLKKQFKPEQSERAADEDVERN